MLITITFIQHCPRGPSQYTKQVEIKGVKIRKEEMKSLITDDMQRTHQNLQINYQN